MSSRNKIHIIVLTLFCSLLLVNLSAQPKRKSHIRQANPAFADTVTPADSDKIKSISDTFPALPDSILIRPDSLLKSVDSILVDSVMTDTVQAPPPKKSPLEDVVKYTANDSIVFLSNNQAYMYGQGVVTYQDIELDADEIRMNMDSSTVFAIGRPDTAGEIVGNPIFKDKSGEYESATMKYNFKSQKGYITNIITQQGEGYLTGGSTKKNKEGDFYLKDGKYTTCDDHECPHFYLQLTKAKMRPKKNIVKHSFRRLYVTFMKLKKNKRLLYYILGYFFYIDGVYTIISMATSYGGEVGIDSTQMILALLLTQIVAFPCAIWSGKLAERFGSIRIIKIFILIYCGICFYGYLLDSALDFWILAVLVGMCQGGIQALSRSYFGKLIPKKESSEYFGFFDIFGKFADFFGPLIISLCALIFHSSSYGVLALIVLFLIGFILIRKSEKLA